MALADDEAVVWSRWLVIKGMPVQDPDPKSLGKIRERLAYGFTALELVVCCERVHIDPSLVGRSVVRAISAPLQSDQRVCKVLGRTYEPPKRATWLTPFDDLWRELYPEGESPQFGAMAKCVFPLVQKHGAERALEQARAYLRATEPQFVSWPKFASGFGSWTGASRGSRSYAAEAMEGLE